MAHRNRQSLKAHLPAVIAALGLVTCFTGSQAWADDVTFSGGSLIIPMQANYQDSCGVTSAYGLIWQILRANQPGHFFANANHSVTVYVIINGNKRGPNRCVPSNLTPAPNPNNPGPSGDANNWDDPAWNDGCDLEVINQQDQPIVPVDYNASPAWPPSGQFPDGLIPFYDTSSLTITGPNWAVGANWDFASPKMPATTLNTGLSPAFTTVQYMGAPFVIDASDAPYVLQFLQTGDSFTPVSYLQRFTQTTDPVSALTSCPNNGTTPSPDYHHVNMHQASVQFVGSVSRRLNAIPPKIALLNSGAGVKWWGSEGGGIEVLPTYLKNANLYFPGAVGCPQDSFSGCTLNGGSPGLIYDVFDAYSDLISTSQYPYGLLNGLDTMGRPNYRIFWAPHWETANMHPWQGIDWNLTIDLTPSFAQYVPNGDGASTQQQNAYNNVAYFSNQVYHGVMAECASMGGYEGELIAPVSTSTEFLFTNEIMTNQLAIAAIGYDGRNCSDPNYSTGNCALLDQSATNPFAQIGDYHLIPLTGAIENFGPKIATASKYRPGVSRLAVSWNNYDPTNPPDLSSYVANTSNGWDFFDFGYKSNDNRKSAIVYIAGHEYSNSTGGNRIVLNTLLNLGWSPIGNERALSHPVAYFDPNGATAAQQALVFADTYVGVNSLPPGSNPFDYRYASKWRFPVIRGHIRAHSLLGAGQLTNGENDFSAATLWDADDMLPLPKNRNLFTYFGGYIKPGPSPADLGGSTRVAPNNIIQLGWTPATISGKGIPNNCVDVMKLGTGPDGTCQMIPGSDGICDIEEAVQYAVLDLGWDCGDGEVAENQGILADPDTRNATQEMLQLVRGFCAATNTRLDGPGTNPILEPNDTQCNDTENIQLNRAHLGGLVHSSPAIAPPSNNVNDGGPKRPTMAYAAGLDGQIHAIYVSGGAGYNPPPGLLNYLNPPANSAFANDWSNGPFNPPSSGTELWAFMPASQLPWLATSSAQVDSSPVVQDVFIDVVGSGIREWHTVLVASVGGMNRELVALDVSNPLRPVLLWDIVGSLRQIVSYPYYSPTVIVNDGAPSGSKPATRWREPDATFAGPCDGTNGCDLTSVYDYNGLGGSVGLSVGEFRRGLEPVTAVFVASNSSGANGYSAGLEVFAIDVATGQKLWEWLEPYAAATFADNTVPPPVSIYRTFNGAFRLYAGDMEGNVWELDASTGMNADVYFGSTCSGGCKFTAFSTQSSVTREEPITTNLAIGRLPNFPSGSTSILANFPNANFLTFGTAGANWVAFNSNNKGQIHLALLDDRYRKPYQIPGSSTDLVNGLTLTQSEWINSAQTSGVLLEKSPVFPLIFTGAHMYGAVTISGQMVFFETTQAGIPQDINWLGGAIPGGTYALDLGTVASGLTGDTLTPNFGTRASYGGVTVYHDTSTTTPTDYVLSSEVSKLTRTSMGTSTAAARTQALDPNTNGTGMLYVVKAYLQRLFEKP